jgi:hypothetical protein
MTLERMESLAGWALLALMFALVAGGVTHRVGGVCRDHGSPEAQAATPHP